MSTSGLIQRRQLLQSLAAEGAGLYLPRSASAQTRIGGNPFACGFPRLFDPFFHPALSHW